jgi:hypothetical protein
VALRKQRPGRLEALLIDARAVGWLARGMWRVSRGRAPWHRRARSNRAR